MTQEAEQRAAEIAAGLTKAQRFMLAGAVYCEANGASFPAGYYTGGDKRVRLALFSLKLTRDYLRRFNRLTSLGLAVRNILKKGPTDAE